MNTEKKIVTAGIVDDDEIFTYGFKKLIINKALFDEILTFANGKEAIDFLKAPENVHHLPDVLFVDINMPVMDGWEFNKAFEEIKSQLGKNIILYNISSSIDLDDIKRAKGNPLIADYILKPIDEAYLAGIAQSLQNPTDLKRYN
ncbi:response regulator transcription factor [Mucilaginibacter phyllosphaerae]|uniref:Response regulator n=1 Tax=Mucilaginibacter phyllosphaerae TaxID=1812349 RepID=A0A4Y8AL08_9SPHI|nr:response regulator [Mucilaginibacter phyllosphaerae]MBB3967672.1 YesN/AraC family two-component response regulator [Mucilaginibacter phyllosphaerae]TEW69272.1 response regulator [Mucilaginibacter phyllosphaerae]GGH04088.1 response regulator [Mucilaginibacter phyllosphaerae]